MKPSGSSEKERTNQCSLNSNSSFLKTNLAQDYKKSWVFYLKKGGNMKCSFLKRELLFITLTLFLICSYAYSETINWISTTSNALNPPRGGTSVVFQNKIWVLGGQDANGNLLNDVWSSSDGVNWTQETASASWSPRASSTAVVFDGKIWIMGGSLIPNSPNWTGKANDVWYSSDGVNWTQATASANWSKRYEHTSVVFQDKMWVIGGGSDGGGWLNDVWYSTDGMNWTQATSSAAWCPRYLHSSVVYDEKMWIFGGNYAPHQEKQDVWYSSDGGTWQKATDNAPWGPRCFTAVVVYNNEMLLLGGLSDYSGSYATENDVWSSRNGSDWIQVDCPTIWSKRYGHQANVWNGSIWVIGGAASYGGNMLNDVWYSSNLSSNLSVLPVSFNFGSVSTVNPSSNSQIFYLMNSGTGSVTIEEIQIQGNNASEFRIVYDDASGKTLSLGDCKIFQVKFVPKTEGPKTATILIVSNPSIAGLDIPISGNGITHPMLRADIILPAQMVFVNQSVSLEVDCVGDSGTPTKTYTWYIDGQLIEGANSSNITLEPFQTAAIYWIEVEVKKAGFIFEDKARDGKYLVINNLPVENEPLTQALDPKSGEILDAINDVPFSFDKTKKDIGLIIITHGLMGTVKGEDNWAKIMAKAIENRLLKEAENNPNIKIPNICRYDWSKIANTSLMRITDHALAQGLVLVHWIIQEKQRENRNENAPIHIIGHSAGGYVASRCARIINYSMNIEKPNQITLLDTPLVSVDIHIPFLDIDVKVGSAEVEGYILKSLEAGGKVEIYKSQFAWLNKRPDWLKNCPPTHWEDISKIVETCPPYNVNDDFGDHSDSHTWYINTVLDDSNAYPQNPEEKDGFYYSPWLGNLFPDEKTKTLTLGELLGSILQEEVNKSEMDFLSEVETFGDVTQGDNVFIIREGNNSNAGIFKTIDFPQNAKSVSFRYKFTTAGDGDFLSIHLKDETNQGTLLFLGPDMNIFGDYIDGIGDVSSLAGKKGTLVFKLVSRGEQNAVVTIDSINLVTAEESPPEPSGDGGGGGGGCFIATAAFGTPMAEEVKSLCEFRDQILLRSSAGRGFVEFYYTISPSIADFIRNKPGLKAMVREILKPLVEASKKWTKDSLYQELNKN